MNEVFADTSFFVALLSRRDVNHASAQKFSVSFEGALVTSQWVVVELANYFAGTAHRGIVTPFVDALLQDPRFHCLQVNTESFASAWRLFRSRPDKAWSLTDCLSFEIMRQRAIREAVTADHHFEQAGFTILLK
jgi:uncharacterized protein